jgi:hypothetical protein
MTRTITLRLSDDAYQAVKCHAEADGQSMNSWIETVLDGEDMHRRCREHDDWMTSHPDAVTFAKAWAEKNLEELEQR